MIKKLWLCGVRIHDVNDTAKLLSAVSQCRRGVLLWGVNKTVESTYISGVNDIAEFLDGPERPSLYERVEKCGR